MSDTYGVELRRQMQNAPPPSPEQMRQWANWRPSSVSLSARQSYAGPPKPRQPTRPVRLPPPASATRRPLAALRRRLWARMAPWLLFSGIALGGCATAPQPIPTVIRTPPPTVPPALLTCLPEPLAPDPSTATQRDVAIFLFDLAEAGQDCRRKLGVTRRLLDTYARETDR